MKVVEFKNFKIVTPEDGYVLTNFKEGDDIKTYSSFAECVCPIECDLKHLTEITIEDNAEYIEQRNAVANE